MCGRYSILTEEDNIEIRIVIDEINRKYNQPVSVGEVFPGTHCAVMAGEPTMSLPATPMPAHWGFANPVKSGLIINARSETLLTKPMFKKLALTSRCIVPASGYFEWQTIDGKKYKKYITTGKKIMFMAGLLGETTIKGTKVPSFVIITTEPSAQISDIHDRMPALISDEAARVWLNEKIDVKYFDSLLTPYHYALTVESA